MRKAFSLVELLTVMVVFAAVSVALAALFATIITDIPKSYHVVQENTSLLSMLGQMRKDIDMAKALPHSSAGYTMDDELLLIELPEGLICYQLKNGEVLRRRLTEAQKDPGEDTKVWSVPNAKVEWRLAGGLSLFCWCFNGGQELNDEKAATKRFCISACNNGDRSNRSHDVRFMRYVQHYTVPVRYRLS